MIPYGKHHISANDINAVVSVLKSSHITQGEQVPLFEKAIQQYCGSQYAIASNSATSSLHLACLALGLTKNDHLWTSPISFVASANCGAYCGATIDFVDIDSKTYNLCPNALRKKLITAKKNHCLPKVLVAVHLAGQSCDMKAIHQLSIEYGFHIIEDAAHAIGGQYRDQAIGHCQYSDITVFSFHPVKIITTGEGGVATTNNAELAQHMQQLRSHGIVKDSTQLQQTEAEPWYYEQIALGYNYRMTDIQAALGHSQISRLDDIVKQRHRIAKIYQNELAHLPITLPFQHADTYSSFHLYIIRLQASHHDSHLSVFKQLQAQGIGVQLHYIPIYKHPYYQNLNINSDDFPQAEQYYQQAISLPIYPDLTHDEQQYVIKTLSQVLQK